MPYVIMVIKNSFSYVILSNKQRKELENYTAKWQTYQKMWESQEIAKEVLQTRKNAEDIDHESEFHLGIKKGVSEPLKAQFCDNFWLFDSVEIMQFLLF